MVSPARIAAAAVTGAATLALAVAPAATAQSAYKTPATGKWKVQDIFGATAGGSAEVYSKGTRMRKLNVTLGPEAPSRCDGLSGSVSVVGTLKITRVGSYKRPAVGRLSSKTKLIEPIAARVKVNGGASVPAKVVVLFEKTGKAAYTARIELENSTVGFGLRK